MKLEAKENGKLIKKLVFNAHAYPIIDIEGFDLCDDKDETVTLYLKIDIDVTKDELIRMMKVMASSEFEYFNDEDLPAKITIEVSDKRKEGWKGLRERIKMEEA